MLHENTRLGKYRFVVGIQVYNFSIKKTNMKEGCVTVDKT